MDTQVDLDPVARVFAALGDRAALAGADEVVRLASGGPEWLATMASLNAENPKVNKSA